MLELDHLVVAGETLADARGHVEQALGVAMQPGGQHAVFGTHNALLHLEGGIYIEAIAKEPDVVPEYSPCWYALDQFSGPAHLSNWACRTDFPQQAATRWPEAGSQIALARGDLRWQMFVPDCGRLPYDNLFPAVLSWQGSHPAARLSPKGCRLRRLIVFHPQAIELQTTLGITDNRVVFEVGAPGLRAEIDTPHGLRIL
ncbi:VOC family protein [Epibacterium ulvae]|uniref:VOC family protein n=1 Tax=Epibacterium ulvae TaxID=1156985 RepID=UPI001BFC28F6|nr:VOC family protein [Epibacterium ulvae]MBT8155545.1 VOC family protein [Epibacterium ulvae]